MFTADDHRHMARALELAERGLYTTTPNPRVGCVIVKDGAVVGEGWHEKAGEAHAEVAALAAAWGQAAGATVYISLEPCAHQGRTPPCSQALIDARVGRVVVAMEDPNPEVAGRGMTALSDAGIANVCGLLYNEARELNIGFVSRMTRGRPWVRLKAAVSLDGKTALLNGRSQWITGPDARRDGHHWRARACAMLTGVGTVKDDDPLLTVRQVDTQRQPPCIVVDSRLETPLNARILREGTLFVAATRDEARMKALQERGAEVIVLPNAEGKVDLVALLKRMARRGINELHVEAGYKLNGSLLAEGLIDEVLLYMAPHLLGDKARGIFDLPELYDLAGRRELKLRDLRMVGSDIRVVARLRES